jgi:hypothetical protein
VVLLALVGCPAEPVEPGDSESVASSTGGETEGTGGALDCSECDRLPECHSHIDATGECLCDAGYQWADPDEIDDFTCEMVDATGDAMPCDDANAMIVDGECFCNCGYTWCSNDPNDLSCCVDEEMECDSTT